MTRINKKNLWDNWMVWICFLLSWKEQRIVDKSYHFLQEWYYPHSKDMISSLVLFQSFIRSFKIFCFISSVPRPILTLYRLKNFDIAKKMFYMGYSLKLFHENPKKPWWTTTKKNKCMNETWIVNEINCADINSIAS